MIQRTLARLTFALIMLAPAATAQSISDIRIAPKPVITQSVPVKTTAPTIVVPTANTVSVTAVVPQFPIDWSPSTPALAQGDLLGGYACAPTSLAMVTASFASHYSTVGSRSEQDFINDLNPGDFVPGQGVPYQKLAVQVAELGYQTITGHMGATQGELRQNLNVGPVIITAGGDVAGARGSHSLVVTALSGDGEQVKVNDPADGQNHTISWAQFNALWAGGGYGIMIVQP